MGALVDSGTIRAVSVGIDVNSAAVIAGGIQVSSKGTITARITSGTGAATGILVQNTTTFGGGITNSGTISADGFAILLSGVTTFGGGINNKGRIASTSGAGIFITSVALFGNSGAGDGVVNSGTISALQTAIGIESADGTASFAGGISNGGRIASRIRDGMLVSRVAAFGAGSAGGITNSGVISAGRHGIHIFDVTTVSGGIANRGTITAMPATGDMGIFVSKVGVFGDSSAGGGITNTGTISAADQAILLQFVTTFAGGIVNSGKLVAETGIRNGLFTVFDVGAAGSGISNTGTIIVSGRGIFLNDGTTFTGNIANTSVIAAHDTGIAIFRVSTFAGGVSNSGRITSITRDGMGVFSAAVFGNGSAGGGFVNSGTISAGQSAIAVVAVGTFAGGISNSGKISAAARSIWVTDVGVFGDGNGAGGITNTGTMRGDVFVNTVETFFGSIVNGSAGKISGTIGFNSGTLFGAGSVAGGITNAGTISGGGGISVNTQTFLGDISNSGKIVGTTGIGLSSVAIFGASGSGGAIVNSGFISATHNGLRLIRGFGTFAGGITNAGVISAGASGIEVFQLATVLGGIVNSGTIAGKLGIGVAATTVAGGILDSGSIKATQAGISIDGLSEVLASKTAIDIAGATFTGGIFNTGVVSGSAGIEIKRARAVSIFNGGTIIGTGGTAIEFAGSGNTLTLGAGYFISGIVDPQSGNNTLQLGGFGSDTFNLSSIGAAAQYQGFTIFNVVGGTWTVTSASTAHWTIKAGTLEIASGGALTSTTVSSGGVLAIDSGATVSGVTIKTGATLELFGGIPLPSGVTIPAGAILGVAGGVYSGLIVSSGRTLEVLSGGTDLNAIVRSGGALIVGSDGTDSGATVLKGGREKVLFGGTGIGASISGGGVETVSAGGVAVGTAVHSGGTEIVSAGGIGIVTTSIDAGGTVKTANGGTVIVSGTIANSGALIASGTGSLLEIDGSAVVSGGAVVVGNGIVDVHSGGTADVRFLSTGSGGLEIADTNVTSNAFDGRVSGFGGVNHANHKQFIDLVSVTSAPNTISLSYVSSNGANTSGTLFVSSGGVRVAAITMVGHYSAGNFHITAGTNSTVAITDPAVPNGGSVQSITSATFPRTGIDLPDIAFGAQTTLAYSQNAAGTGGTLTVSDGRHTAAIALLGNYMAASFVAIADGHGGTLVTGANSQQPPLQLTHPLHG